MACFNPKKAYQYTLVDGTKKITFAQPAPTTYVGRELLMPCGKCNGCRSDRQSEWAIRVIHETSMHEHNTFLTLTYNDANLPTNVSLVKSDFSKFMKRLRKKISPTKIRYYMCGEYGKATPENNHIARPHYHAIIFGLEFEDKIPHRQNDIGQQIWRSASLEKLWTKGFSEIGSVSYDSAAYVAGYIHKKIYGQSDEALNHYTRLGTDNQLHTVIPEYTDMSRNKGIGYYWYKENYREVFPDDFIIVNSYKKRVPKYYWTLLEAEHPIFAQYIKDQRRERAQEKNRESENTPGRLLAREQCHQAKLDRKERPL